MGISPPQRLEGKLGILSVQSQLGGVWEGQGKLWLIGIVIFGVRTHLYLLTPRAGVGHEDYYFLILNSDLRGLNFVLVVHSLV